MSSVTTESSEAQAGNTPHEPGTPDQPGQPRKHISRFNAICLVAGSGIGGGVMAVPYLVEQAGIVPALVMMALAYLVTLVLHLMFAELSLRTNNTPDTLTMFRTHLFKGNRAAVGLFYALMLVILTANLAAYVAGGADILASITGLPWQLAALLFFVVAALVVLFGLRGVATNETIIVPVMLTIIAVLAVLTVVAPEHAAWAAPPFDVPRTLAVYGMVMFALSSLYSVPQAASGLANPRQQLRGVVACGLGINLTVILVVTLCTLAAASEVTPVAIIGWSQALGPVVNVLSSLFVVFALLSTYWSISLQLADITIAFVRRLPHMVAWLIATLPAFALALFTSVGFLDFMSIAGGAVAVVIGLLVVPAYFNATKSERDPRRLTLGRLGMSRVLAGIIICCYLLMAVGSLL